MQKCYNSRLVLREAYCQFIHSSFCRSKHSSSKVQVSRLSGNRRDYNKNVDGSKYLNPYARNVGMARQLKGTELTPGDQALGNEDPGEILGNLDVTLEDMRNRSKEFRTKFKIDEEYRRHIARKKIIEKKLFPKPPNPPLLTWMEKEMIKYLHKKDPVEWSVARLSESFPATTDVIIKVLRSQSRMDSKSINRYNLEVVKNWKLLSKGKLDLEPHYVKHLKAGSKTLGLTTGEKTLVEQEILINSNKSRALPKPSVPGEFASIIVNYNRKIKENCAENLERGEVLEMEKIFGDNTIPGTPLDNEVSAFSDTALLATSIDLSKECRMDVEKFRSKYLKREKNINVKSKEDPNSYREKYFEWLQREEMKSRFATKTTPKIDIDSDIISENSDSKSKGDEIPVKSSDSGEIYVFDPETGYQMLTSLSHKPDFINIPNDVRNKYKFYQLGDSFYGKNGEFLYRVPGLD